MRVLDEEGKNLGVLPRAEALRLAKEKGLDLILLSGTSTPPVARIMSFDKFRYIADKKRKEDRIKQKHKGSKQVQISVKAAKHDLELKAKKVAEFFAEGYPVVIAMVLRGREKGNKQWAQLKTEEFMKMIPGGYKQISPVQWGGRGFSFQVTKP